MRKLMIETETTSRKAEINVFPLFLFTGLHTSRNDEPNKVIYIYIYIYHNSNKRGPLGPHKRASRLKKECLVKCTSSQQF